MKKLLASAPNQDAIKTLIGQYWFSKDIRLSEIVPGQWQVFNNGKRIEGFEVRLVKGRYRFEGTLS